MKSRVDGAMAHALIEDLGSRCSSKDLRPQQEHRGLTEKFVKRHAMLTSRRRCFARLRRQLVRLVGRHENPVGRLGWNVQLARRAL